MDNKVEAIIRELSFNRPYETVDLWVRDFDGVGEAILDVAGYYKNMITCPEKSYIEATLNWLPKHKFEIKDKIWVLPLLASDFYVHNYNKDNAIYWAKIALKNGAKSNQFADWIINNLE